MKIVTVLLFLTQASIACAFTSPVTVSRSAARTTLFLSEEPEEAAADEEAAVEEAAPTVPEPAAKGSYTCISREEILSTPNTIEFQRVWDPLKLSELGSDETLAWFRHSEVKHGRVAMAAFVGWWVTGSGLRLPGELAPGLPFDSFSSKGLEAWDQVPGWGKVQLLLFAGLIEFHDELFYSRRSTHYLRGGVPGKNMVPGLYDPFGWSENRSEEAKARGRDVEIKNGRLAMIGFAGLWAAATIPGSVPLQPPC